MFKVVKYVQSLTIKTPERKYYILFSIVSTADFEQVNVKWEYAKNFDSGPKWLGEHLPLYDKMLTVW